MKWFDKRVKLIMLGTVCCAVMVAGVVNLTDACKLAQVTVDDVALEDFSGNTGLDLSLPVTEQKLDSTARMFLDSKKIYKVDISVSLPDKIEIITNNFLPVSLLADQSSGKIFGLDADSRIVPLKKEFDDWEQPVVTGLKVKKEFSRCSDPRLPILVGELLELKQENIDLFRMIDEINFGKENRLKVYISGLDYHLLVRLEKFNRDLERFVEFVNQYEVDLGEVKQINLSYNNLIVCRE